MNMTFDGAALQSIKIPMKKKKALLDASGEGFRNSQHQFNTKKIEEGETPRRNLANSSMGLRLKTSPHNIEPDLKSNSFKGPFKPKRHEANRCSFEEFQSRNTEMVGANVNVPT